MTKRFPFIIATTLLCCASVCFAAPPTPPTQETGPDFRAVAKKAIPAVVSIRTKITPKQNLYGMTNPFADNFFERFFGMPQQQQTPQIELGQGSGFLISPTGSIVTNRHVVKDAEEIVVVLSDGREFTGKVLGIDPNTDVALVKIEATDLPYLQWGDSSKLEVGEWVAAIGNPMGLQASLTVGVVSAKGRNNLDLAALEDFIQTDAAINRGNSGGPLLNLNGEVVGMNTAIASNLSGGFLGIGFAIPSEMSHYIVEQLEKDGSVLRGYLGVLLQQITSEHAKALGLDKISGVLVAEVQVNSPAAQAGIKRGDIILKYNSKSVDNPATFRNAIALMKPNTPVKLDILRAKKPLQITLKVGTYPESTAIAQAPAKANALGIQLQPLTPELAQKIGSGSEQGVVISNVEKNSLAALAGIKAGSLLIEINQQPVTTVEAANQLLNDVPISTSLLLLIRQDGVTRYIALTVR